MKRLIYYPPLHFVVFLIIGICLQVFLTIWSFGYLKLACFLFLCILFLAFSKNRLLRTYTVFILFIFLGVASVYVNNSKNNPNFYKNKIKSDSWALVKIKKSVKSSKFYNKYYANVVQIDTLKATGTILLNVKKDSLYNAFKIENLLWIKAKFNEIPPPLNPYQFNYKAYLANKNIFHQAYLNSNHCLKVSHSKLSLIGLSSKIRGKIQNSLRKYSFKNEELAVLNALLLGQRKDMSKELITNYQNAGAIHILAVSGLHVGVILLILSFLFKPLEKRKYGMFFKTVLIVLFLWMFAFLTGLSASVLRAVTMFTFVAIAMSFKSKTVVEFSLLSSMFVLLLVKPLLLFDIGLQLSYLAVFSIVWVQPKLYLLWKPRYKLLDYFWKIVTVSSAAQIGVLPLSIFYFNQFPGLFWLSNLVIIPFLMYILIFGIVVIIGSIFNVLPNFVVDFFGTTISLMNSFVKWVSSKEVFLFSNIKISFLAMLLFYVVIVFCLRFLFHRCIKNFKYLLISFLAVQIGLFTEKLTNTCSSEFLIFHRNGKSIFGKRTAKVMQLQHNIDSINLKTDYVLKPYILAKKIEKINQVDFKNYIQFSNIDILIVDSLGVYKVKGIESPIVYLQQSPKINVERLIKTISPTKIIADGSNYKYLTKIWQAACKRNNIQFYNTSKKGAFILTQN